MNALSGIYVLNLEIIIYKGEAINLLTEVLPT